MAKTVLDVGNCAADHGAISRLLSGNFDVEVVQAHGVSDTLEAMRSRDFDLVLVNRIMDRDGSEGLETIREIKKDSHLATTPVIMITNYAEHQALAVEAGAEPGFGKSSLTEPATVDLLRPFLDWVVEGDKS